MYTLLPKTEAQPAPSDADRTLARLNRIAPTKPGSDRSFDGRRRPRHGTGSRGGIYLGFWGWLVVEVAAVAVVIGGVLVWPPARACRAQQAGIGFYGGDTLGKCVYRGVAARLDDIDQSIKMTLRGSRR